VLSELKSSSVRWHMACRWSPANGLSIALPKGGFYVSTFVTQCHLLYLRSPPATDNYLLTKDSEFKKAVGCDIDAALRRAKVTGRTLFKGHTFYISKQTKLNFPLLEKVIKAAGGQVDTWSFITAILTLTFVMSRPTI
jgi:hypothetical protein